MSASENKLNAAKPLTVINDDGRTARTSVVYKSPTLLSELQITNLTTVQTIIYIHENLKKYEEIFEHACDTGCSKFIYILIALHKP